MRGRDPLLRTLPMSLLKKPVLPKSYLERRRISFWCRCLGALVPSSNAYAPAPRIQPEGSWVEITRRRESIGYELRARLYLFKARLIISSVAGISEYGEPTVLPADIDADRLGLCICDHLLQFRPKTPSLERNPKLKDWKSFEASGAKSGREFRENAWIAGIETMNSAILINAKPYNSLHNEIAVQGMTNHGPHQDIGNAILRTLKAASILRESGVI